MTRRALWTTAFLGVAAVWLAMELWASWDDSADTVPLTWLIVDHVNVEFFALGFGGLVVWLSLHFGLRYWHRYQQKKLRSQ